MAQWRSTPVYAPFSRSSRKPNAARSDTGPSGAYRDSATGWMTSSAGLPPNPVPSGVGGCAGRRARLRQKIVNLVDELHWQAARWLTSNYKVILLPTFETQDMTRRAGRRIRSKTARMMLSLRHYEFKRRLLRKAWQRGVLVLEVNEAYTSKTCSWDGSVR